MVEYQPPESVLLMVGASVRSEALIAAALRLAPLVSADQKKLSSCGIDTDAAKKLEKGVKDIQKMISDPSLRKNDTPFQMSELAVLMGRVRSWLDELRQRALIDLSLDRPAIEQIWSAAPEVVDVYPRDLLADLNMRVRAASELRPRLEEVGINAKFIGRGRDLASHLKTAIGAKDFRGEDLKPRVKLLYNRKAHLLRLEKRVVRAGRLAFAMHPKRRALYHLDELEPAGS